MLTMFIVEDLEWVRVEKKCRKHGYMQSYAGPATSSQFLIRLRTIKKKIM